jgi:hypothetical protein
MDTWQFLKSRAHTGKPGGGDVLVVGGSVSAAAVVDELTDCFGSADDLHAIRLVVDGEDIGFVADIDIQELVGPRLKGIGDADHAAVPGEERFRLLRLRCPVRGCPARYLWAMTFDEADPPACVVHPDRKLELKP